MNTSIPQLDPRGADGRYMKLMGPMLQPNKQEKAHIR